MMVLKQRFFVDLEKGLNVKAREPEEDPDSDEEYTMLLPDYNTCDSCVKKQEEEKEQKKQEKLENERVEKAWRECMLCDMDKCAIL